MAEDGESPRIVKANELRREAASGISRMRANVAGNALSGSRDLRPGIEASLETANNRLAALRARLDGVPQAPATQTSDGKRIFEDLARQVGYEPPSSATTTVETAPAVETKPTSSSIFDALKSLFKK